MDRENKKAPEAAKAVPGCKNFCGWGVGKKGDPKGENVFVVLVKDRLKPMDAPTLEEFKKLPEGGCFEGCDEIAIVEVGDVMALIEPKLV